ncbi:MAG TPA: tetratricopeptide repeat protein, partial [Ktedonobacteraceae bacterium]|nr:tetratricopeptide repeat protein [Ktedonobacteraceae bacterium]
MQDHAESANTILTSLTAIARLLQLPGRTHWDQQSLRQGVRDWMQAHPRWLLVLDNVEDVNAVSDLLSPARRGHVVITTRSQITGKYPKIEVPSLPVEDGALLVLRKAQLLAPTASFQEAEEDNREAARQIALTLGGLPLALEQAGAYIDETGCSLAHYLERYQAQRAALLRRRGIIPEHSLHPESVAVTLLMALEKIEQIQPPAADLLRLCAFLAPDAIPIELFARCAPVLPPALHTLVADPGALDEAMVLIRRYSLLHSLARQQALGMHRVVQAVIQDDLEAQGRYVDWEQIMVAAVTQVLSTTTVETIFTEDERYVPHALAAATVLHKHTIITGVAGHLLYLLGHYLTRSARYEQAEIVCQDAVWLYGQRNGALHREIGVQLNNLAQVYEEKREHAKAYQLFEQAWFVITNVSPCSLLDAATALNNLARCLRFQGRLDKAEQQAQHARMLGKLLAASEPLLFASTLLESATIARERGHTQQAEHWYRDAQQLYEATLPPDHASLGYCYEALGTHHLVQGHLEQAHTFYQKALTILEHKWGKDHPDVAGCLYHLAEISLAFRDLKRAEKLNRRALDIYEAIGGPEYLDLNQPLQGLAMQYIHQGRYDEAEPLCQRAIALIEHSQGADHPELVSALEVFAWLRLCQGALQEANALCKR